MLLLLRRALLLLGFSFGLWAPAFGADPHLHFGTLDGVRNQWVTVNLPRSYSNLVVVATPSYGISRIPGVARVRNAFGSSFQVRIQPTGPGYVNTYRVHYAVAEAGVYRADRDGVKMEARRFLSDRTAGRGAWVSQGLAYQQPYTSPVVLGQVMTHNDSDWSVFFAHGANLNQPPTSSALAVGKHVGEDSDRLRANEQLGIMVFEAGSQQAGATRFHAGITRVGALAGNPPYNADIPGSGNAAVASPSTMNGGDGAFPLLWGVNPLAGGKLALALDEDLEGDSERLHTDETVAYVARQTGSAPVPPPPDNNFDPRAGQVNYWQFVSSSFDPVIRNANASTRQWMVDHYDRMLVYSPFFDGYSSWYRNGWEYEDLYGVVRNHPLIQSNPEWILKSAGGNRLYIPFACNPTPCVRYAMDFGNQGFRNWWINKMRATLSRGNYRGIFLDDVNMTWRVSNASGSQVLPIDPRTGQTMTLSNWRRYMAEFLEQIAGAFPNTELAQNIIWYAGDVSEPLIRRAIDAADLIHLERGFMDRGLRGQGRFSLENFHGFIDFVHSRGKPFLAFGKAETVQERNYDLANYLLMNRGSDYLGEQNLNWTRPSSFWSGFDVQLGGALDQRYVWNGAIRRDFENGMVLVNPPDRATLTLPLGGSFRKLDGQVVSQVTLGAKQGVVLKRF